MNKIVLTLFLSFSAVVANAQSHKNKCGVEVEKAYTQEVLGKNVGYYIELKNTSNKTVDAIEWKANFYSTFGEIKGNREGSWSAGNFIKPVEPNAKIKDLQTNWIDGANKVYISIVRVHFTDGSTCGRKK
jgi:hypothetical protein